MRGTFTLKLYSRHIRYTFKLYSMDIQKDANHNFTILQYYQFTILNTILHYYNITIMLYYYITITQSFNKPTLEYYENIFFFFLNLLINILLWWKINDENCTDTWHKLVASLSFSMVASCDVAPIRCQSGNISASKPKINKKGNCFFDFWPRAGEMAILSFSMVAPCDMRLI